MPPTLTEPADSELLERFVRQRDENAFQSLVVRHQPMVTGAALRRTGDMELSRDVAQRVFVTLARKADRLVTHARLGGWLYKTSSFEASRAMQSEARRRKRERAAAVPEETAQDEGANWAELEDALAGLSDAQRELVVMRYFEDRSYADIANDLDLSEAATRKRLSRALGELGERLARSGIGVPADKLLLGAVAVQASLAGQKGLAASTLFAAASSTLLPTIMTSTTAKTCVATIALAAIPLSLQWSENRALANELASIEPPAAVAVAAAAPDDSDLLDLRELMAAGQARLERLKAARVEEDQRKAELEETLETLGTDLVVSLGTVGEMASECAGIILEFSRVEKLKGQVSEDEANKETGVLITKMLNMMPTASAVAALDDRPELNARFYASIFGRVLDLDEQGIAKFAAALLPEMERFKKEGLVISERPPSDPGVEPGETEWDKRYMKTAAAYADVVAPLMPEGAAESETWRMFAEGEFAAMLLMVGAEESPLGGGAMLRAEPEVEKAPAITTP